jgi:8-oxo-dGTP diphosphatase
MSTPVTPLLTVDIVIELADRSESPIVLIQRLHPPYGWALPGGFVDVGETLEAAAVREAEEETGLRVSLTRLLGCYSDPRRDPRGHTVSAVYLAQARGEPRARDDAKEVGVYRPTEIPTELAFDHAQILRDYLDYKKAGRLPLPANS